jgi:hypothetical protein
MCLTPVIDPLTYPAARERPDRLPLREPKGYTSYEVVTAGAGTGGAFSEIGRFSGVPDAVEALATGGDALVILSDELGTEESAIRLVVGLAQMLHISRRVVLASNVSDAAPSTVRATGKWLA